MNYPFDDQYLIYDYNRHRYYLTEAALNNLLGISFNDVPEGMDSNPSTRVFRFCNKVTDDVYRFLLKDSMNAGWLVYELATTRALRPVIQEMLLAQAEYAFNSGFSGNYSGVDVFKGVAVDRDKIRAAMIAPAVEDYAYAVQPSLGRAIKYAGNFGYMAPPYEDNEGTLVY